MSKKELDESILKIEKPPKVGLKMGTPQYVSKPIPLDQQGEALCFDIKGVYTLDDNKCAAKIVKTPKNGANHFIKWCKEGPDKGHLLNPCSLYFREGDDVKMEPRRGELRFEFRRVSEVTFSYYLKFLQTKIYYYCQQAEKEILDA